MKKLCIYHGNCADGFGGAWVVRKALGADNVDFHPGVYQDSPPDVAGRDVILVDFSYKKPVMEQLGLSANSITIIDHHKSAIEDLKDLETKCDIVTVFDMDHSGAMLAFKFFFPDTEPPTLLKHIEDRDLWRFAMRYTREVQANLFSYPYDFDVWDELMATPIEDLIADGTAIERKHFKDIKELIRVGKQRMTIAGYDVPVLNAPYFFSSDAGHIMAQGEPFAACYWDTPEGRVFSLRSADDGLDVSEIAKQYGGGGHKHAAGFRLSRGMTL
jgi:oligoribonuclease NrnB/cAMP/cGMP phosphodiesterase (DHH superfamily)